MPTITKITNVEAIDRALDNLSDMPHVRNDYSGRGMYGDKCFGITLDGGLSDLLKFFLDLGQAEFDLARDLGESLCSDDMGLSTIYYFPGFVLEGTSRYADSDDEEWDDDDDE